MLSRKYPRASGAYFGTLLSGLAILLTLGAGALTATAGDLLRGGAGAQHRGTAAPGGFTAPSVQQARQDARDVLARTSRALQSVRAMESAARHLAVLGANNLGKDPNHPGQMLPGVPNGLNLGGLVPDSGLQGPGVANSVTSWVNAGTPTQSLSRGKTTVTVVQTGQDAILNWNSFNIGKDTTLSFNQARGGADVGKWIAFNFVHDPSAVPSQILGTMRAPGQVYVINQNGIIFGGASQVNLHALVASSLPINMGLVSRGLLNNPSQDFLFSAFNPSSGNGASQLAPSFLPGNLDGAVTVQAGAEISVPTSPDHVGGKVALIGPGVTNDGTISTPDGQTILAAGLQVAFAAHPSADASLRGLDVYVGAVANAAYDSGALQGQAVNGGLISVPRGDVTITGRDVQQLGAIDSTTSVTLNGRIDLLASYGAAANPGLARSAAAPPFLFHNTGSVELGAQSVSQILPELGSIETVAGTQLALSSAVRIDGQAIHFAGNATLLAPGAGVAISAGFWGPANGDGLNQIQYYSTAGSSPQVCLDAGATIDVAGSADVSASVTQNIIPVQLLGAQLAGDPLQRFGIFRGQTINVDIRQQGIYNGAGWIGTPLADASGYAGLVQRTVGELTTAGGTVNINAGGSVVMQPGSEVNVSGGWINYQGGIVDTSKVISGGHIYDISQATPDLVYQAIYNGQFTVAHPKYGLAATYTAPLLGGPHFENGYVFGGNAGAISIAAPGMALDGQLLGRTENGPRQRQLQAKPGGLSLSFSAQNANAPNGLLFPHLLPHSSHHHLRAESRPEIRRRLRLERLRRLRPPRCGPPGKRLSLPGSYGCGWIRHPEPG